jgi:hypothetical protein
MGFTIRQSDDGDAGDARRNRSASATASETKVASEKTPLQIEQSALEPDVRRARRVPGGVSVYWAGKVSARDGNART